MVYVVHELPKKKQEKECKHQKEYRQTFPLSKNNSPGQSVKVVPPIEGFNDDEGLSDDDEGLSDEEGRTKTLFSCRPLQSKISFDNFFLRSVLHHPISQIHTRSQISLDCHITRLKS